MNLKSFLFENTTVQQTIAKNTLWLFGGQVLSRLMRAAIVIYAARILGAASYGAFAYALGIATFLTSLSDIGINALITKEGSRDPALRDRYIGTAFFTKIGLLLVLAAGVLLALPVLTTIPEARRLLPILLFVFAFDTLRDLGSAVARAMEKMQIEALFAVFTNLVIAVLGFLFLTAYGGSTALAIAYAAGSAAGCAAIFIALHRQLGAFTKQFDRSFVTTILRRAWPFGLLGLMGAIMLNTDIIMLGWMRTPEEVGYYSAAQKLIQLLYVLPSLVATSMFPVLARFAKSEPARARDFLERSVAGMGLLGLAIAAIGVPLSGFAIGLLYGAEYLPAVFSLQILIATAIFVFPSTLLGNAVFAYDQERNFLVFVIVSALSNAALNVLLIPPFGIAGASAATLIVQIIMNTLLWIKVRSITGVRIFRRMRVMIFRSQA